MPRFSLPFKLPFLKAPEPALAVPQMGGRARRGDAAFMSGVRAAQVVEAAPHVSWVLYLMAATLASALTWASVARVDEVTKADARVVPEGREQVIASLEGGILRELFVKEGEQVEEGQDLAELDPTRFQAQQAEGETKMIALKAQIARLTAEAMGRPLAFPAEVEAAPDVAESERESYLARKRANDDAAGSNARGIDMLRRELQMSEAMSAKGLLSEVEVLHLRRQINEMSLQTEDRMNRFRQDASSELAKLKTELAALQEQQAGRQDVLERTKIKSPVRGIVKNIRINTLGGVIGGGAPIMEIVPIGKLTLIEAHVKPGEIGFLQVGQVAKVKLSAYDFALYGAIDGRIESISPDALGDPDRPVGSADPTYYRVMLRVDANTLHEKGKTLPLLPGMTGSVEVRIGERSVLNFLLRPMLKSKEAFRER
ncbi:HlyD family type I secretion periplasmic adaptor subunit [Scleromatobacter humisilvae]|uniref:Membrane fusion protein (MFP) family protein n=1 Tax=Scleromatobacter humisilvae TaxID=2897159 RepID=A0A9X1YI50_9BURK|nr:HlyD family type I secretion periplasmic adaptor subunit [Scleromatobacter humisilvae]MCK9686588.1 HlyD family type I secretion periplasmic adaptor subunit [Scleromatobacter humisilvae]